MSKTLNGGEPMSAKAFHYVLPTLENLQTLILPIGMVSLLLRGTNRHGLLLHLDAVLLELLNKWSVQLSAIAEIQMASKDTYSVSFGVSGARMPWKASLGLDSKKLYGILAFSDILPSSTILTATAHGIPTYTFVSKAPPAQRV